MKTALLFLSLFIGPALLAAPPVSPDAILGVWSNGTGKGHIRIYKQGNEYFGKIIWLRETKDREGQPRVDKHNPDPAKRTQPVLGMIMLRDFRFEDGEWTGGRIYNPSDGNEYKAYIKMNNKDEIAVRGYVGISLIGKTDTWTRVK